MSPIQQMLLGVGGAEDDVFQVRVWQSAASLGSGSWSVQGQPSNYFQYSDGSYLLSAKNSNVTNIQTDNSSTMSMCITNDTATGFAKSVNHWGTNSGTDYCGAYPYRGSRSSGKDMTIFPQQGYYYAWQGSGNNRWSRWIMIQDSLSNNCADLKKYNWTYSGYYTDWGFSFRTKDGTDDDYWIVVVDYASSPSSRSNVRWGKMNITSSSLSLTNMRRLGGDSSNGSSPQTWTSDDSHMYICGLNQESSRSKPFIMKCTDTSIVWYKEHYTSSQNNYVGGVCEVDSSGNVYYASKMRKNNAWEPVLIKLNSSGTVQWSLTWEANAEPFGSAINGSKLYICWRYSNNIIISEHDTSDGSINWQNKIDIATGAYQISSSSGAMKLNKDNNLDIYLKIEDSASVIYGDGCGLFSGIPADGSVGNGKIGSIITYASTTDISLSSHTSYSTSNSYSQNYSTVSANSWTNYTGNLIGSNNTDSQLTNINDN